MYRHISGRADLLVAMVSELVEGLFDDELMSEESKSWEEYLQRVANSTHNLALKHPRTFPLIAAQPPEAPWLRPPVRSVRWVEHFLSSSSQTILSEYPTVQRLQDLLGEDYAQRDFDALTIS